MSISLSDLPYSESYIQSLTELERETLLADYLEQKLLAEEVGRDDYVDTTPQDEIGENLKIGENTKIREKTYTDTLFVDETELSSKETDLVKFDIADISNEILPNALVPPDVLDRLIEYIYLTSVNGSGLLENAQSILINMMIPIRLLKDDVRFDYLGKITKTLRISNEEILVNCDLVNLSNYFKNTSDWWVEDNISYEVPVFLKSKESTNIFKIMSNMDDFNTNFTIKDISYFFKNLKEEGISNYFKPICQNTHKTSTTKSEFYINIYRKLGGKIEKILNEFKTISSTNLLKKKSTLSSSISSQIVTNALRYETVYGGGKSNDISEEVSEIEQMKSQTRRKFEDCHPHAMTISSINKRNYYDQIELDNKRSLLDTNSESNTNRPIDSKEYVVNHGDHRKDCFPDLLWDTPSVENKETEVEIIDNTTDRKRKKDGSLSENRGNRRENLIDLSKLENIHSLKELKSFNKSSKDNGIGTTSSSNVEGDNGVETTGSSNDEGDKGIETTTSSTDTSNDKYISLSEWKEKYSSC